MKILFVGLGSIGQRHLKNIRMLGDFEIDAFRTKNVNEFDLNKIYTSYSDVPSGYDIIFITNPTSLHHEAISKLSRKTKNMFIEKPIFDKPLECSFSAGINYIACPLRYSPAVKELREYVKNNKVYSFRAICSSYLPNWRQTGDYRTCYSANATMGGGVRLDLIHEIDYLKWIFGDFESVKSLSGQKSELEISSEDVSAYIFENKNVIGSLHLDYFGRTTKREVEVFAENETKLFDLTKNNENIYIDEMKYFLSLIKSNEKDYYNMPKEALRSLEVALS